MWLLIACIAPALWAVSNLIDVYFVESIYTDEYDGAIISGLFQILPWAAVLLGIWDFHLSWDGAPTLFISGMFFLWSLFFYFKALFSKNDVALAQLLWNLTAPVTLLLAWIFYSETLTGYQYAGFVLVLVGAACLGFKTTFRREELLSLVKPMSAAILLLSASMLLADKGYESNTGTFFDNYLVFALGNFVAALSLLGVKFREGKRRFQHLAALSLKYFFVFFAAELIALIGYVFSQRAIDLSPSAALVAAIESLIPVFIMLFSIVLLGTLHFLRTGSAITKRIYQDQIDGYLVKIIAAAVIAAGIYCLSLS